MSSSLTASLQAFLAADSTLTAACPGGVRVPPAPQGVLQPFVELELLFGADQGYGGGPRITEATFTVAAIAPAVSVAAARTAATRLDAMLDYAHITASLTGFRVLGVRRVSPVDEAMEEDTGRWVRVGGEYQLFVETA